MAENKLTDKALRALKPRPTERLYSDGGGLWVRALPQDKGGAINFYYRFQVGDRERRFNCGTYPATTLAQAREQRNVARILVKQGIDPVDQEQSDKAARAAAQASEQMEKTVRELFQDWKHVYLAVHRKDGGKEVEDALTLDVLPYIGGFKARVIRLPHVVELIDRIVKRGSRRKANYVLSLLRQMFRHGLARGLVDTDPTMGLSKKHAGGKEVPSERNLSLKEIKELADNLLNSGLPVRFEAAIWILLATGARVGELTKACWREIDLSKRAWQIPKENSKNGRAHLIHLSAFTRAQFRILESVRENEYVLAGRTSDSGLNDKTLSKAVRDRIRSEPLSRRSAKTGTLLLSDGEWSLHDLRRTFASRLGDLEVAPHVIERCLNHVQRGIVGVYQRQEYVPQRAAALDLWGRTLSKIVGKR